MLVSELIEKLKEYPADMKVCLQGYSPYETLEPEVIDEIVTAEKYMYDSATYKWVPTEVVILRD